MFLYPKLYPKSSVPSVFTFYNSFSLSLANIMNPHKFWNNFCEIASPNPYHLASAAHHLQHRCRHRQLSNRVDDAAFEGSQEIGDPNLSGIMMRVNIVKCYIISF